MIPSMPFAPVEIATINLANELREGDKLRDAKKIRDEHDSAWKTLGGKFGIAVTDEQMVNVLKATLNMLRFGLERGLGSPPSEKTIEELEKAQDLSTTKGRQAANAFFERLAGIYAYKKYPPLDPIENERKCIACEIAAISLRKPREFDKPPVLKYTP
ncbi:MAG: hypothetical protein ABH816_03990 [Candidatus Levyibacteriota bacterium]